MWLNVALVGFYLTSQFLLILLFWRKPILIFSSLLAVLVTVEVPDDWKLADVTPISKNS